MPRNSEELRRINPLGKIPALLLDDGSVLIDSPVICEYLNHVGGGKFFPGMSIWRAKSGRWKARRAPGAGRRGIARRRSPARYGEPASRKKTQQPRHYRVHQASGWRRAFDALERLA